MSGTALQGVCLGGVKARRWAIAPESGTPALDDANSEIYYAQLVEEEASVPVLAGLKEVVEHKGVFCALYSDRGSHFWLTPKAGEAVDHQHLTQVGRAMRELGVRMIPAYSPQARGRSERSFGTWQGRLPQELRLAGCRTVETANAFLREHYIAEFDRRFQVAAAQAGSAFVPYRGKNLERIFSLQFERTVNRDNTVSFQNLTLQIEPVRWRGTLAGCTVIVHQHLDGTLSVSYGPHSLGRYDERGGPIFNPKLAAGKAVEESKSGLSHRAWKSRKVRGIPTFPPPRRRRLEINQNRTGQRVA